MKKIFLLLTVTLCSISCSPINDELPKEKEDINPTEDIILGTWKLSQQNGQAITDTCEKKDTYTFKEDGSYTIDDYSNQTGTCIKDEKNSYKGYWLNNNNNTYNLKKHGFTGPGADLNIEFSDNKQELTFSNNKLTYKKQ
ncbi:lipocalin family protein [Tenacibaculum aestuariivivum]|uniref:lipocalin family protein n=1 Tax=Tenacibaculum aestuariivivum TaxID=2006131 RepID=UPI003AB2440C